MTVCGILATSGVPGLTRRIGSIVVQGIGFLGAGAIIQSSGTVGELTTAASMWVVAGIGIAAGFGYYALAITTSFVALVLLAILAPWTRSLRTSMGSAASPCNGNERDGFRPKNPYMPGSSVVEQRPEELPVASSIRPSAPVKSLRQTEALQSASGRKVRGPEVLSRGAGRVRGKTSSCGVPEAGRALRIPGFAASRKPVHEAGFSLGPLMFPTGRCYDALHMKERTLVLIKPDGVQRGLVSTILERFRRIGLKPVAMKMVSAAKDRRIAITPSRKTG